MKTIDEILLEHGVDIFSPEHAKIEGSIDWCLKNAIKEIVNQTVDACVDNATVALNEGGITLEIAIATEAVYVDKQSILNVKNLIK